MREHHLFELAEVSHGHEHVEYVADNLICVKGRLFSALTSTSGQVVAVICPALKGMRAHVFSLPTVSASQQRISRYSDDGLCGTLAPHATTGIVQNTLHGASFVRHRGHVRVLATLDELLWENLRTTRPKFSPSLSLAILMKASMLNAGMRSRSQSSICRSASGRQEFRGGHDRWVKGR